MNSEELEQSLKAEFESYIKGFLASMREDVTEFQIKIDAELEKHRSQLDAAFRGFSERFENAPEFDAGFKESVIEHLRLARDEGAKITATAISEAEKLEKETAPDTNLNDLKDAINDICSKDSQSSILKSLIHHAAKYTPRGVFFIIKNAHFVGWKIFGKEAGDGESAVRDIHFPVAADSILGSAAKALSTVEGSFGSYAEDAAFLDPLQFGKPDRMYAIPLIARGRGVAVLYADYGHEGVTVNTDALEMLVRVAGLTVELLASSKAAPAESPSHTPADLSDAHLDDDHQTASAETFQQPTTESEPPAPVFSQPFSQPSFEPADVQSPFATSASQSEAHEFDFKPSFDTASEFSPTQSEPATSTSSEFSDTGFESRGSGVDLESSQPAGDFGPAQENFAPPLDASDLSAELRAFDSVPKPDPVVEAVPVNEPAIVFEPPPVETNSFEASPFNRPAEEYQPAEQFQPAGVPTAAAPAVSAPIIEKVAAKPAGSRLSDRHVDLPIEVAEDERRAHNDARRFARLLVSEIKLYNEKKVQEGRENNDLYERLREAIDRSREMYDKRVQTPVASKFDYFHYELVNALADGDVARLGPKYPGATV